MVRRNRTTQVKREREQKKRERQQRKAEKAAEKRERRFGQDGMEIENPEDQPGVASESTTENTSVRDTREPGA